MAENSNPVLGEAAWLNLQAVEEALHLPPRESPYEHDRLDGPAGAGVRRITAICMALHDKQGGGERGRLAAILSAFALGRRYERAARRHRA